MTTDSNSTPRILLLGGNGFLGAHLAQSLRDGWQLRTFDRPGSRHHGVGEFVPGDIANSDDLDAALDGCGALVYLVHDSGVSPLMDSDRLSLLRNLELLMLTLESARRTGVGKIAFISSGGTVYGVPESQPVGEDHPLRPISAYGVAKASMEMYLRVAARQHGLQTLIVRPSNPYGPGQNPQRKQGVVSIFTHRILRGEQIEIWGDGESCKDYLHVRDLTDGFARLLAAGFDNQCYNIGSGMATSLNEIVAAVEKVAARKANVVYRQPRTADVSTIILDPRKLEQRIGPRELICFEAGIREMVDWLERQRF